MTYLRRQTYYMDLKPIGYAKRVGPFSTRSTNKAIALQMESTVKELALLGRHRFLDGLRTGLFGLPELHAAKINGRLDELLMPSEDPPLRQVVSEFLRGHPDPRHSTTMRKLLEVAPAGARLSWINNADHLRTLVRLYRSGGLSAATERRETAGVSQLLKQRFGEARRRELISDLDLRVPRDNRTRWLTAEEITRLRKVAEEWWVIIGTAIATGARRGELFALEVCDLDFEVGAVVIQRGKSRQSRRRIPLHGEALTLLRDWVDRGGLESGDLVFGTLSMSRLRKAWDRIRIEADLDDVRFHDLRHTFAVHCAKAGMPLGELQQRLGHAAINMTMRYAVYQPPISSTHYAQALQDMGLGAEPPSEILSPPMLRQGGARAKPEGPRAKVRIVS